MHRVLLQYLVSSPQLLKLAKCKVKLNEVLWTKIARQRCQRISIPMEIPQPFRKRLEAMRKVHSAFNSSFRIINF
jgi:hypothetical protein